MDGKEKDIYKNIPLGKLFSMITKPYYGALTLKMQSLKIEKNFSVLILLQEQKNCTQQCIADTLQIDKVSMVKIIDGFTKQGLVKRTSNPSDRRCHLVELTPKGHKVIPEILKLKKELDDVAFQNFTTVQKKQFMDGLVKMYENVKHFPSSHVIVYKTKKKT